MADQTPTRFASLSDAMNSQPLRWFGVDPGGVARDPDSDYRTLDTQFLTFDVSNGQMLCSVTAEGLLRNACSVTGLHRTGAEAEFRGAYVGKDVVDGGPWPLAIRVGTFEPVVLHDLPDVTADLLCGVFPLFTYRVDGLCVRQLVFAPVIPEGPVGSPRAIIVVCEMTNESPADVEGALVAPDEAACLNGGASEFSLGPGQSHQVAFAFVLGRDTAERTAVLAVVSLQPTLVWLNQTWAFHSERLGRLSIPDGPVYAESLVRMGELCRQSVLHLPDGRFAGGFWGSAYRGVDAWETPHVWVKDVYHAMLPMGMFAPELCLGASLWFLEWGAVGEAFGRGLKRFPQAAPITHSLCNALASYQLAGEYYRCTGDGASLREHPELLEGAVVDLDAVISTRQCEDVWLFPAMYISDGDARGDWHSGSNVVVWDAMSKMARLAREVYDRPDLAERWSDAAEKIKHAIETHCITDSPHGRRLFEGANLGGTTIAGHDGEETDTTLMPFYGFCDCDAPALTTHARLALSDDNPLYWPETDGVWWVDEGSESMDDGGAGVRRFGATFPAWTTGLAGAVSKTELLEQLQRIRRLTDLDGSIWWWPFREGDTDPRAPRRDPAVMKCAWAAGVYVCLFVQNVLGLRADRPERSAGFCPRVPWSSFEWTGCRLGANCFDVTYQATAAKVTATLTNRNAEPYDVTIEVPTVSGSTLSDRATVEPGQTLTVSASL